MKQWHHEEPQSRAAALTEIAAALEPRQVDLAGGWETVLARATRPSPSWKMPLWFVASAAVGALLMVLVAAPFKTVAPTVLVSPSTSYSIDADGTVQLRHGTFSVTERSPRTVRIVTPHLALEARLCRFSAEVTANGTVLAVEEGEAQLRADGEVQVVRAGETATWPRAPELPAELSAPPRLEGGSRCGHDLACLRRESEGAGLEAQAALYELGRLQSGPDALETWSQSLRRFPQGVLGPEVRIAMLAELLKQRRFSEALDAARALEVVCPDDARRPEVTRLRIALERMQ